MSYEYSYAANTPISGPAKMSEWKINADFNGILWSNKGGFFFVGPDDDDPITEPNR
jgi:hypothetical protein